MKEKEIVWIFGTSSAGKQTFIDEVVTNKKLAKDFGWQDKVISVCQESIDYPGSIDMPEIVKVRNNIPDITLEELKNSDVVLIKWQYVDSSCELPQQLKGRLPHAKHKIILLEAPQEEMEQRLNTKDWWKDKWGSVSELVGLEHKMVEKFIKELQDKFEITAVDSSSKGNYAIKPKSHKA